eukprot:SAG25_NODE_3815_length_960_cov_1.182346_2_plen_43_part_01
MTKARMVYAFDTDGGATPLAYPPLLQLPPCARCARVGLVPPCW